MSALAGAENLELDAVNCYNRILSQHPEYKYAFALTPRLERESLTCEISYMPYRSGAWPQGFQGVEIGSLSSLIGAAEENLDKEGFAIRITEPSLTVDDMNKALQQVGGGYLLCQLSRDGTAVTVTAQNGLTQEEALDRLTEIDALSKEVCSTCITPSMTAREKAQALYTYLTDTVKYDMRYYSDRENLPYEATTAYGALHDHLAICGGYAQALQALFRQAGIPCYTVSGKLGVEYHMWVTAKVDGTWLYFDPTNDRGWSKYGFRNIVVTAEELAGHTWDEEWTARLLEEW